MNTTPIWVNQALQTVDHYLASDSASRDTAIRAEAVLDYVHYWTRQFNSNLSDATDRRYTSMRLEVNKRLEATKISTLGSTEQQALINVLIDQLLDSTLDAATLTRERDDALAKTTADNYLTMLVGSMQSDIVRVTAERDAALALLARREVDFLHLATESEGYREALEECVDSAEVMRRALDPSPRGAK